MKEENCNYTIEKKSKGGKGHMRCRALPSLTKIVGAQNLEPLQGQI
jgi:hypothetical protein